MLPEIKEWLGVLALLISIGGVVYAWLTSGSKTNATELATLKKATGEALKEFDDQLDKHDSRIQALESEFKHLPDRQVVHELQLTMKDIQIELAGVKAGTEAAARTSRRVEEFLIANGAKAA